MKTYVLKVGNFYITSLGDLSLNQADALRVSLDSNDVQHGSPRGVRLRTIAERAPQTSDDSQSPS